MENSQYKIQTQTKTEVYTKTVLTIGIISAFCVAFSFLTMLVNLIQKIFINV